MYSFLCLPSPFHFICNSDHRFLPNPPFLFTDRESDDEDEPDLPALATLDFAALKDVRQTGAEYCHHYEALLHNTPGLQPGYLPEEESRHLVTGVSSSFLASIVFLLFSMYRIKSISILYLIVVSILKHYTCSPSLPIWMSVQPN